MQPHSTRYSACEQQPGYFCWLSMRQRCNNPNNPYYSYYGGRGITVCERWNSYAVFIADMGPRPSPAYSIDRIDNNGNYEPGNCRWATKKTQQGNRRQNTPKNHLITWRGETLHAFEWCRRLGFHEHTLHNRIVKSGWSIERAMTTPVRHTGRSTNN